MSSIDRTNKGGEIPDGMTPAELARYRELLSEAYPCPSGKIRDSVMKTVLSEAKVKKKATARSLIVKWGSLAACIVIIGTVCLRILPQIGLVSKDASLEAENAPNMNGKVEAPMEMEDSEATLEDYAYCTLTAITEDCEEYDSVPPSYGLNDENCAEDYSVAGATDPESTPDAKDDTCGDVEGECEPERERMEFKLLSASPTVSTVPTDCEHSETFMNSYHDIPAQLSNFVGNDEYSEWLNSPESDISCKNIIGFIEYFDIEKWVLDELVSSTDMYYLTDYPTELIYSGDSDKIEEYYRNGGDFAGMVKRATEYNFKLALLD